MALTMDTLRNTRVVPSRLSAHSAFTEYSERSTQSPKIIDISEQSPQQRFCVHWKLVVVVFLPIVTLIIIASISLSNAVFVAKSTKETITTVANSNAIRNVIKRLQIERGITVLFLKSNNTRAESHELLRLNRDETDTALLSIQIPSTGWEIGNTMKSKYEIEKDIHGMRNETDKLTPTVQNVLDFYTKFTFSFFKYTIADIKFTADANFHGKLSSNNLLLALSDVAGIMRAMGTVFFIECGYTTFELKYVSQLNGQEERIINTIFDFDESMKIRFQSILKAEFHAFKTQFFWNETLENECKTQSVDVRFNNSKWWFNSMTIYIDKLFDISDDCTRSIQLTLQENMSIASRTMYIYIVLQITITIISLSGSAWYVYNIERISRTLSDNAKKIKNKTEELKVEKRKTDKLLFQMMPKKIAIQLREKGNVRAEEFQEVTVFFSDIVGFTSICCSIEPMQIVDLLNEIYNLFDDCIDKYDVYKVETIGDAYMVASGVPSPNGQMHACEICRMSLDLREAMSGFDPSATKRSLQIRIGINSGSCVAGIVGRKMPRYCLFGDTINTASRMESCGQGGKIQISESTKEILDTFGTFSLIPRGRIDIKGKGNMCTYWLESFAPRVPVSVTLNPEVSISVDIDY